MPANEYSDGDLYTMASLEKIFWIEIAKRKAFKKEPEGFARLEALRENIEEFCLSEIGPDGPVDGGGWWQVLKAFENGGSFSPGYYQEEDLPILSIALDRFQDEAAEVQARLSAHCEGFVFTDFASRSDIEHLHHWWSYITSDRGKKDLGTTKSHFSSVGEERMVVRTEDDLFPGPTNTISSYPCPVSEPLIVRRQQSWVLATDEHDITVNSNSLNDHLVLVVDLSKPLPPMALIKAQLEMAQVQASGRHSIRAFQAGHPQDDKFDSVDMSASSARLSLIKAVSVEHEIFKSTDAVATMIFGLYAWDLIEGFRVEAELQTERIEALRVAHKGPSRVDATQIGFKLSVAAASRITVARLCSDLDDEEVANRVRSVSRAVRDVVAPRIQAFEPSHLPWLKL